MQFGEKVRKLRKENHLSQQQLADAAGVSLRTITSYEKGTSYPRFREVYTALAEALHTTEHYLKTEEDDFMEEVSRQYGSRGQQQAAAILGLAGKMFAGGELSEEDEIAFLTEIQQLFLDSKKRAKKFTPKKYSQDAE